LNSPHKVLPEIERLKPCVLKTSLSEKQKHELRAALEERTQAAA
jgi:uncharacterized membrane protein